MSAPAVPPAFGGSEGRERRANWLGRLLKVDKDLEDELRTALKDASDAIDDRFAAVDVKENWSAEIQRTQVALAQTEIRQEIRDLFDDAEDIITARKQDAAVAAVNARLYDQRGILSTVFAGNESLQAEYANSLRATARRNVETVETRVLETKIPLSKQVYKSSALAIGQVDSIINSNLAQGRSYKEIAKAVTPLIDPNVPGGVSYAAIRLGRSEIANAFHAQAISDALDDPWIEFMRWELGMNHAVPDECDAWHQQLFPKHEVPDLPHPNCWCTVLPELPDWDTFSQNLTMGTYDDYLDEMLYGPREYEAEPTAPAKRVRRKRRKTRSDKGVPRGPRTEAQKKAIAAKRAAAPAKPRKKRRKTRSDKGVPRGPRGVMPVEKKVAVKKRAPRAVKKRVVTKRPPTKVVTKPAVKVPAVKGYTPGKMQIPDSVRYPPGLLRDAKPGEDAWTLKNGRRVVVGTIEGGLDFSKCNTIDETVALFRTKYPDVPLKGFEPDPITGVTSVNNVKNARELLQGLDTWYTMIPEMPQMTTRAEVESLINHDSPYAMVGPRFNYDRSQDYYYGKIWYDSQLFWDKDKMADRAGFERNKEYGVATKFKVENSQVQGWTTTTIHEGGHILHNMSRRNEDITWIRDEYERQVKAGETKLNWNDWAFQETPSRYCFVKGKWTKIEVSQTRNGQAEFYSPEFRAESSLDVILNGYDNAKRLSQMQWDEAMEEYQKLRNQREWHKAMQDHAVADSEELFKPRTGGNVWGRRW